MPTTYLFPFQTMQCAMSLSNNTLKTLATTSMKVPAAALSTTAANLDQAYRIEADTFGELKVSLKTIFWMILQPISSSGSSREILWSTNSALSDELPYW